MLDWIVWNRTFYLYKKENINAAVFEGQGTTSSGFVHTVFKITWTKLQCLFQYRFNFLFSKKIFSTWNIRILGGVEINNLSTKRAFLHLGSNYLHILWGKDCVYRQAPEGNAGGTVLFLSLFPEELVPCIILTLFGFMAYQPL